MEALTDSERAILKHLDDLPAGARRTIGREQVTAEAPYFAASGESCRQVAYARKSRLACKDESGWYFAPDVFSPGTERP